jgi:hypothetical protein
LPHPFPRSEKSKQLLDQQYAVNAVANAILVQRLSKAAAVARFVLVSSEAHRWAKPSEVDATLDGLKNPPPYTTTNAFDQYSRCNGRRAITSLDVALIRLQEQIAGHDVDVWCCT